MLEFNFILFCCIYRRVWTRKFHSQERGRSKIRLDDHNTSQRPYIYDNSQLLSCKIFISTSTCYSELIKQQIRAST
jgi:hypothetical protein